MATYEWRCKSGHRFRMTANGIVHRGAWCVICSGRRPHSIESMRALAKARGGVCVSREYQGVDSKLEWRCARGHVWTTLPYLVLSGSWCPECAGRRAPPNVLETMQRTARDRGGRCLARKYTRAKDDYEWECQAGHRWNRSWDQIKGGRWCPRCVGRLPPAEALAEIQRIARKRGGRCMAKRYSGAKAKLEWSCKQGHRWRAPASDIRSGRWCGRCAGNVALSIEEMHTLAKSRGGKCLSITISGANRELEWRCAFGHVWSAPPSRIKHSGAWCPTCARSNRYSLKDMQRVAAKRGGRCLSREFVSMNHQLEWQCAFGHTWSARGSQVATTGTWCPVCWGRQPGTIAEMRALAEARGGVCLSKRYVDSTTKLRWRCEKGHEWQMAPVSMKKSHWCPICRRRGARGIEDFLLSDLARLAKERGGACLSDRYVNAQIPLRWRCQLGHEWEAAPGSIVNGSWCPACAHTQPPTLDDIKRIARERGGECLSKRYVNATTRLLFECRYGHRWRTRPPVVRSGSWCPKCARQNAFVSGPGLSLEDFHEVAHERGGECLSDEYLGSNEKLEWRCGLGHEWSARAGSVRRGTWCPVCGGRAPLTLDDMHRTADVRGGRCLSKSYRDVRSMLTWECSQGHQWKAKPQTIRSGSWCPRCLEKAPDAGIARVSKLAWRYGGVCLSAHHRHPATPLRWRCARGHVWRALEETVIDGTWCPRCRV